MTTYYISTAGGAANGLTTSTPWDYPTFASHNILPGDVFKFKRGESAHVFTAKRDIDDSCTLTTYYNADGTDDETQTRPKLEGNVTGGLPIFLLNVGTITLENLEIYSTLTLNGTTDTAAGVYFSQQPIGGTVENCKIHGCRVLVRGQGFSANYGEDVLIKDCELYDCWTDAVWASRAVNWEFNNCTIYDVNQDATGGDCLQFVDEDDIASYVHIHDCTLTHQNDIKQVIIINNYGLTAGGTVGGTSIIEDNIIYAASASYALYTDSDSIIRRNIIYDSGTCINLESDATGPATHEVYSNICLSKAGETATYGVRVLDGAIATIYNNYFLGFPFGVENFGAGLVTIKNNIIELNSAGQVAIHVRSSGATPSIDYNCYYPAQAGMFELEGVAYDNLSSWQTAISDDANSLTSDPLLNSDYEIGWTSPCLYAGVVVDLASTDFDGYLFGAPPNIGAHSLYDSSAFWPSSLPQYLRLQGYAQARVNDTIRSTMGYGPDKVRRRTTGTIENIQGTLVLTNAQLSTLSNFYNATLTGGAERFNWVDFLTVNESSPTIVKYRFLTPPTYSNIGKFWTVVLSLELLP